MVERALQQGGLLLELGLVSTQFANMLLTPTEETNQAPGQDADRQRNHRKDDGVVAPLGTPTLQQFLVVDRDGNDKRSGGNRTVTDDVPVTPWPDHRLEGSDPLVGKLLKHRAGNRIGLPDHLLVVWLADDERAILEHQRDAQATRAGDRGEKFAKGLDRHLGGDDAPETARENEGTAHEHRPAARQPAAL